MKLNCPAGHRDLECSRGRRFHVWERPLSHFQTIEDRPLPRVATTANSATHIEEAATKKAIDTVQVDDKAYAFAVLVQIALDFGRLWAGVIMW
jgi:hypothetical protein